MVACSICRSFQIFCDIFVLHFLSGLLSNCVYEGVACIVQHSSRVFHTGVYDLWVAQRSPLTISMVVQIGVWQNFGGGILLRDLSCDGDGDLDILYELFRIL